ncbi:MAG: cytochrome c-type biogenesis CcmF C-terminal domain-containing protein [Armatimonadota bacterium]|nr:cytochrome c-type biogenesis CcmF C-terminal domain-containing protein [Armatimonadota bacterium]MDR7452354.1 cytochrome c-type biogenesis CcmF C-terminal domain-containing protein [Armatimonadota bacterium]MDR7466914.1 cytochrome c-type biogenesis CcmF C-terminal domain-containing protein [Armatimonadota bacterium]MDR7493544.1 cytochrome c-type biogenesis CcmF C-terminal domain-containing protein [Armatimonadota bacterium]MDR7498809.1 cytochrome c-type biogenesis CcmF C-terminal domain-cont
MSTLGSFALLAALVVAAYGLVAGLAGLRRRDDALLESSRRALVAWAAFAALASAALLAALLTRDFSIRYVAETSSRDLPLLYTVTAFWGGHAGSLLLWALVLGLYGVAAATRLRPSADAPLVFLVLLVTAAFFTLTLVLGSNPFASERIPPPDGRGLNPLLRNPWMAVHPPALYLGFVGTTVPFALVVASLVRGPGSRWLEATRAWMRPVWCFLTLGLLFGAKWSYVVLGWGGYWAWDPVENAALMPWLTSTAFLHSAQVHGYDGSLGGWTRALVLLTFLLAILGTFLTRSGVLSSVHAFAHSTVGVYFLAFLTVASLASCALLLRSRREARPAADSALLSREVAFLVNNVLFVVAVAAVLFGTLFPLLAEAVTGDRINVGPPYFNQVMVPIVLLLLLLMAVGPLLSWRRTDPLVLSRRLALPAAAGVLSALAAAAAGLRRPLPLLLVALGVLAAATTVGEFVRGAGLRRNRGQAWPGALLQLVGRGRTRYGGYLVHLGVLIMLAGIAASSAFTTRVQVTVAPGERFRLGRYEVRYDGVRAVGGPGLLITEARLTAADGRTRVALRPRHLLHTVSDQITAEVAIRSSWRDDLYVVLIGLAADRRATFRALLTPGMAWLWTGALVALAGGVLAATPARRRVPARQAMPGAAVVPEGGG